MSGSGFAGAALAMRERRSALAERWLGAFRDSALRLPLRIDPAEIRLLCDAILGELAAALADPTVRPGSPGLRELEKRLAFAGGHLGAMGASGFDLAALLCALRDTVLAEVSDPDERDRLRELFDWLGALAFEGYVTSREEALRLRHRDALERGMPVVLLAPELPAAFLVGDPDRSVLDATFGRLLLSIVRVGARATLIDASGLLVPADPRVTEAAAVFASHRKVAGRTALVVSGLAEDTAREWRGAAPPLAEATFVDRFEDAHALALDRAGFAVTRKR